MATVRSKPQKASYQATTITDVSGVTSLSSTSAAGYLNLIKIMHSADQRYHSDPTCRWVFNQNVLAMIESILTARISLRVPSRYR